MRYVTKTYASIPLGTIAALRKNTMTDSIAMGTSIFVLTVPNFWLALSLILFSALGLRWFPSTGYLDPTQDFFGSLKHFVMPAAVAGGVSLRHCDAYDPLHSSMLDELNKQYVSTARAQGLPEWKSMVHNHGARIARRLLSNTAMIVSRLTFYAAFDATTGRESAPRIGPCYLLSHQVNVKGIEV
jgi:ABC-type dipeptide/oligopeptide/nickel transport system permease component